MDSVELQGYCDVCKERAAGISSPSTDLLVPLMGHMRHRIHELSNVKTRNESPESMVRYMDGQVAMIKELWEWIRVNDAPATTPGANAEGQGCRASRHTLDPLVGSLDSET